MCSQYEIKLNPNTITSQLTGHVVINITEHNYNSHVYPFTKAPVIIKPNENDLELVLMNYSLIPYWSDNEKPKFATYNARLDRPNNNGGFDKIFNAPTWRMPFQSQRCLVPLTGFFESCRIGSHAGNIIKFSQQNQHLLFAAGIYDKWINPKTKQIIHSYAIITDEPNEFILSVGHDRQPVFLAPEQHNTWLNHKSLTTNNAYDFLKNNQVKIDYDVSNIRELKIHHHNNQASLF